MTVSPTVEERLVDLWREANVKGYHATNSWDADYEQVEWFLAAVKEHGLVIGEGELDAAEWRRAYVALAAVAQKQVDELREALSLAERLRR